MAFSANNEGSNGFSIVLFGLKLANLNFPTFATKKKIVIYLLTVNLFLNTHLTSILITIVFYKMASRKTISSVFSISSVIINVQFISFFAIHNNNSLCNKNKWHRIRKKWCQKNSIKSKQWILLVVDDCGK